MLALDLKESKRKPYPLARSGIVGDHWISIGEAAVRARLSYNVILRLVMIGELHGTRRGLRWSVDADDVERLVAERATAVRNLGDDGQQG